MVNASRGAVSRRCRWKPIRQIWASESRGTTAMRRAAAPCYLAGRRSVAPVESPLLIGLKLIVLTEYVTATARARERRRERRPVLARRALTAVGDKKLEPERLGEAAVRLEVVAVLAVAGGVLGAREGQALPVGRRSAEW